MSQMIFERYELKYMLTQQQHHALLRAMEPFMSIDAYGHTTICNIYYDTDSYRLIRSSLDRPVYKEKLRMRSYGKAQADSPVFVELKKKYNGVVYKRRTQMPERQATAWLDGTFTPPQSQIVSEIDYFMDFYKSLHPVTFLSYERDAYYSPTGEDLRMTFDSNVLSRQTALSLRTDAYGNRLLSPENVLLEVKTATAIPLWLSRFLTQNHIYKTNFSKYGEAYCREIRTLEGKKYA